MDDKAWNDYLTGLNTGVAFGAMGELGRSHRYEPPPPPPVVVRPPPPGPVMPAYVMPAAEAPARPAPSPIPLRGALSSGWIGWWDALTDFELHDYWVGEASPPFERLFASGWWRVVTGLLVLAGALCGYLAMEGQGEQWFGAIVAGAIFGVAPYALFLALMAALYIVGGFLSLALYLAIVATMLAATGAGISLLAFAVGTLIRW